MALNKIQIKQSFSHAAHTYDSVAQLQRSIGQKLLHLFFSGNLTGNVVDVGCGTGFLTQSLQPFCQNANLIALDLAVPMLNITKEKLGMTTNYVCADAEFFPFSENSLNVVASNVALQWCLPIEKALNELHRVLKNDGFLAFSIFGSQTLCELKTAWTSVDDFAHVNDFYNSDDLKQLLATAGFVEIEIKRKIYQSNYDSVLTLMRELKNIGAHNVNAQRIKTLTSKKAISTMIKNYPLNNESKISATFDVIFVKAVKK